MRKRSFRKNDLGTAHLDDKIVLSTLSRRNQVTRNVRKENELGFKFLVVLIRSGEKFGRLFLEKSNFLLDFFGLIFLTGLHEAADNGCLLLLLRQKAVTFCLEIPSVGVQFKYLLHDRPCVEILDGKLRDHSFRIFTKHFQCQHILLLKFCKLSLKKKRTGTKTRSQPSLFYSPPSLVLKRYYRNIGFVFLLLGKLHCSVNQCIKSVVLAHSDELVRIVDSAPLADDDVTGLYDLTAKLLDTESF